MHLALFTDGLYPYVIGGIQKHAQTLAIEWANRGIQVSLFHPGRGTQGSAEGPLAGFSAANWAQVREIVVPFPSAGRLPGHYIRENRAYAQALLAALRSLPSPPDFVYAQALTGWALAEARRAGETTLPPVCASPHGLEMFQIGADWKTRVGQLMLRPPMRAVLRQADVVHSLGGKLTDILLAEGILPDQIWEVSGGIEAGWFRPAVPPVQARPQRWIFIGRFERRKGVQELQAVLPDLLAHTDTEMTFVGPIPEEVRIEHPRVHYRGLIKDAARIRAELDRSDVLICPSYAEGMPIVIMEAMARGLAVVATDTGATRALVDSSNGALIPPASVPALQKALAEIQLLPSDLLQAKKQASLDRIRSYSWDQITSQLLGHIEQFTSLPATI